MGTVRNLPWPRIVSEGLVIVASILLAFAIDAWWERRTERSLETVLLADLHADFAASQAHLETWLAGNRRTLEALQRFLSELRTAEAGAPVEVELEWLMAAVGTPTYSPTDVSLRAAVAAGRVELLQDEALRNTLATWRQQLDDTQEDELLIRQLVTRNIVPELAGQARLGPAFDFDTLTGWFTGKLEAPLGQRLALQATLPLEAAIAERVFYQNFVVRGLGDIHATQARILELLEADLARRPGPDTLGAPGERPDAG